MAIQSAQAGGIEGTLNQVNNIKKQGLKNKISFQLEKQNSKVHMSVNKNLLEGLASPQKGSKVNVFA